MKMTGLSVAAALLVLTAAPAQAGLLDWLGGGSSGGESSSGGSNSTPVPAPGNIGLFLIGVAGLVIGRRISRARRNSDGQGG